MSTASPSAALTTTIWKTRAPLANLNMYVGANSGARGKLLHRPGRRHQTPRCRYLYAARRTRFPCNWGAVNLATENDFIASRNLVPGDVNGDGVVNGNGSGPPPPTMSASSSIIGSMSASVNSFLMGDLTSRTTMGDLNFDGRTSLADWAMLRAAHGAGASLDLASLLGASIPEPSTVMRRGLRAVRVGRVRSATSAANGK